MSKVQLPDMPNLPNNSYAAKEKKKQEEKEEVNPKKLQKVVSGKVVKKKKPLDQRIVEAFAGEEVGDVKGYIFQDVLVPAIKDMISDAVSGGIDMILFGETRRRTTNKSKTYTSYGNYYRKDEKRDSRSEKSNHRSRSSSMGGDIILETRQDAENVLYSLFDALEQYGAVRVADLTELLGETGPFTDNYWGWEDLSGADIKRVRDGYLLVLPRPIDLK